MHTVWKPIGSAPRDGTAVRVKRVHSGSVIYDGPASWERFQTTEMRDPITKLVFDPGGEEMAWVYPAGHPERGYRVPNPTHWAPGQRQK